MLRRWAMSFVIIGVTICSAQAADISWTQDSTAHKWSDDVWTIDGTVDQAFVEGSNVTITSDAADSSGDRNSIADLSTSIGALYFSGTGTTNFTIEDGVVLNATSVANNGATVRTTISGGGKLVVSGEITLPGDGSTFILAQGSDVSAVTLRGNGTNKTLEINGKLTLTGAVGKNTGLTLTGVATSIGEGADINTSRLALADHSSTATTITMTVGLLNITGTSSATDGSGSFTLGHWPGKGTINVSGGTITSLEALLVLGKDGTGDINISGSAIVNLLGITASAAKGGSNVNLNG